MNGTASSITEVATNDYSQKEEMGSTSSPSQNNLRSTKVELTLMCYVKEGKRKEDVWEHSQDGQHSVGPLRSVIACYSATKAALSAKNIQAASEIESLQQKGGRGQQATSGEIFLNWCSRQHHPGPRGWKTLKHVQAGNEVCFLQPGV